MIRSILLWSSLSLSTALSAGFFFSLGEGVVTGLFMAALGIVFEGLKAFSWKLIGQGRARYLWLGVPCTVLSLGASFGYASFTLEQGWSTAEQHQKFQTDQMATSDSLAREADAILEQIQKLPPGWTSSALRLTDRIDTILRQQRVQVSSTSSPDAPPTSQLAFALGKRFSLDTPLVVTLFLFAVAIMLEVGIIVLVLDGGRPSPGFLQKEQKGEFADNMGTETERFLRVAVSPDGTLFGRRRLVELGWSERQVRDLVTSLVRSGDLVYAGRGHPIRLSTPKANRGLQ